MRFNSGTVEASGAGQDRVPRLGWSSDFDTVDETSFPPLLPIALTDRRAQAEHYIDFVLELGHSRILAQIKDQTDRRSITERFVEGIIRLQALLDAGRCPDGTANTKRTWVPFLLLGPVVQDEVSHPADLGSSVAPGAAEEPWEAKNRRRISLINKEIDEGLTALEKAELRGLQEDVDAHVDALHPLPTREVSQLLETARRLARETVDPGEPASE